MTEGFLIEGGRRLEGTVHISGSKSLATAAMAASLLTEEVCFLENVPRIEDVKIMASVLHALGATVEWTDEHALKINAAEIHSHYAPSHLVVRNRASFLVMGPLLTRFGEAAATQPGGDAIGLRPIDVHLTGFAALGAHLTRMDDKYFARSSGLLGAHVFLDYPSHTGTENLLMAATLAKGETILQNASCEPEVVALTKMLNQMGAKIKGVGTRTLQIEGVSKLQGTTLSVIPDRIEAGTYAMAAAITGGEVLIESIINEDLDGLWWKLKEIGAAIVEDNANVVVRASKQPKAINVMTFPFPGFATDFQPMMGALLTQARGISLLVERVYNNRLLYTSQLRKMGAEIVVAGQTAIISGPTPLTGRHIRALDIRSGAALILAGLIASGQTRLDDAYHVDRGYECIEEKLQGLGAKIERKIDQKTFNLGG